MEQLDRAAILAALSSLNERLSRQGITGELCLYGGGTMVLAFNARLSTHDLDAVFVPSEVIRVAAREVAEEFGLRSDWINDGVKGFLSSQAELVADDLPQFDNLRLLRPTERYLLAMKCLAARAGGFETQGDKSDIEFLVNRLQLRSAEEVLAIVEKFYPATLILPKTRFLVEEVMAEGETGQANSPS